MTKIHVIEPMILVYGPTTPKSIKPTKELKVLFIVEIENFLVLKAYALSWCENNYSWEVNISELIFFWHCLWNNLNRPPAKFLRLYALSKNQKAFGQRRMEYNL